MLIKKLLFISLLLSLSLMGETTIINSNIYERTDRVDFVISFDKTYDGIITYKKGTNTIKLSLNGATMSAPVTKKVNSKFLSQIDMIPFDNRIEMIFTLPAESSSKVIHSKISDGYGLRLRIFEDKGPSKAENESDKQGVSAEGKSLFESITPAYIITMVLLALLVIFLLFIKRRVDKKRDFIEESAELSDINASWFEKFKSSDAKSSKKEKELQLMNSLNNSDIPFSGGIKKRQKEPTIPKVPDNIFAQPENPIIKKPKVAKNIEAKEEDSFEQIMSDIDRDGRIKERDFTPPPSVEPKIKSEASTTGQHSRVIFEDQLSIGKVTMLQYKSRRYLLLQSDSGVTVLDKFALEQKKDESSTSQNSREREKDRRVEELNMADIEIKEDNHHEHKDSVEELFKDSYELKI